MADRERTEDRKTTELRESRGGGQPNPKPPSGEWKKWEPPKHDTTPANRPRSDRR